MRSTALRGDDVTIQFRNYGPAQVAGLPRRPARDFRQGPYARVFKRLFDLTLAGIAAVPVLAVVLPLALVIALDGGSPFYVQERVGRGGRIFRMWKLRTMVHDADARLERHLAQDPAARAEWDAYQKLKRDPRITRLGELLRRTSLDELPQLWNVLRGEMSIVGPRPFMPSQAAIYPGTEYYALVPGLTGPWQVSIRNEASFAERATFDREYFRTLSLRTDLRLILRTVGVLLHPTGS
ncbi:MAG: sugar transferase [Rubellimicrobium sp.]|nr:sugar transferase [Rubellimicrobium sp.]